MTVYKINIIGWIIVGLFQLPAVKAQYEPINPFVMPDEVSLNWYGSGDINNDHVIGDGDLFRLDSMLSGLFSDPGDERLTDRADMNGDQTVSMADRELLLDLLEGKRGCLPGHWNCLESKGERIDWLEKILAIDRTEEMAGSYDYSGDFYSDQLIINLHGFEEDVLNLFSSPPIDYRHNGRFNLPVSYAGVFYNRPDLTLNRNLNAILIGNNVFDWADWCFIDPQWDQLIFPTGFGEPTGDESFPPINNYLDGINNITQRDSVAPKIELSIPGNSIELNSGYLKLDYTLSDLNLKSAYYYIDNPQIKQVLFKDSLTLDEPNDLLVAVYNTTGKIDLMLKNGRYSVTFEATDHFYNQTSRELQVVINDPPPQISILSPVTDSIYSEAMPSFHYTIEEPDFSRAWYTLDAGLTTIEIPKDGNLEMNLINGNYQLILFAEDLFGNQASDTVNFEVNYESTTTEFRKAEDSGVVVYPNPVMDYLNILAHNDPSTIVHLSIQDANNRVIWESGQAQPISTDTSFRIDFSRYPSGVYFLHCTMEDNRTIMKMIIKQ